MNGPRKGQEAWNSMPSKGNSLSRGPKEGTSLTFSRLNKAAGAAGRGEGEPVSARQGLGVMSKEQLCLVRANWDHEVHNPCCAYRRQQLRQGRPIFPMLREETQSRMRSRLCPGTGVSWYLLS